MKTAAFEFRMHGLPNRLTVQYGFSKHGEQAPYFSITAVLAEKRRNNRWVDVSFGCQHDLIRKHAPRLAHLIRWHLTAVPSGPMHYYDNGVFWWTRHITNAPKDYETSPEHTDCFKSTVVFGALDGETDGLLHELFVMSRDIGEWMLGRLTPLMAKFREEMTTAGLMVGDEPVL